MPKSNPELAHAMGRRMAQRRKELGLTQEKVAELAGIAHQQYNKAEKGKTCLGSDTLLRISVVLNISADHLLCGKKYDTASEDALYQLLAELTEPQRELAAELLRSLARYEVGEQRDPCDSSEAG